MTAAAGCESAPDSGPASGQPTALHAAASEPSAGAISAMMFETWDSKQLPAAQPEPSL